VRDDADDDLYTADDVEEMLAVAVLKATQRDREELAGLRAALRVAELADLPASIVRKALILKSSWEEDKHPRDGGKFASKEGAGAGEPDEKPTDAEPEEEEPFDHDEYSGSFPVETNSDLDAALARDFAPHDAASEVIKEQADHLEEKDQYAATVAEFIEDADERKAFKVAYQDKRKELERAGLNRQIAVMQASSMNVAIERTEKEIEDARDVDLENVYPDLYPEPPTKKSEIAQYKADRKAAHAAAKEKYRAEKLRPLLQQKKEYEGIAAKKFAALEQASDAYVATADELADWIRGGGSVLKALGPDPTPVPVPDDADTDPDDTDLYDGDPAEDLFAAALEVAEQALRDGTDAGPVLAQLYALRDDPDALREALGTFAKAHDPDKHPRGRDGRFISKDAIADAKTDPAKAKELRDKVKPEDAKKLDDALTGKTDLGTTARRQQKDAAGERRKVKEAAKADRKTAFDLAHKMMMHEAERTADNFHAIIPHLGTMTGSELQELRMLLDGKFGGKRKVSERAQALTEWARKQALDARMDEQGFTESEKESGKDAVGATDDREANQAVGEQAVPPVGGDAGGRASVAGVDPQASVVDPIANKPEDNLPKPAVEVNNAAPGGGATPPTRTQQDIAADITARRRAKGPRAGADDAKPTTDDAKLSELHGLPKEPESVKVRHVTGTLTYLTPEEQSHAEKQYQRAFGGMTDQQVAALVGAPDGADIKILWDKFGKKFDVTSRAQGFASDRYVKVGRDGKPRVENFQVIIDPASPHKGTGARLFARQVDALTRTGQTEIKTNAKGSASNKKYVGYKVWPKLGYDGPVPNKYLRKMPAELRDQAGDTPRLSDVLGTDAGRKWWDANGGDIDLAFDLRSGSASRMRLAAYLAGKTTEAEIAAASQSAQSGNNSSSELDARRGDSDNTTTPPTGGGITGGGGEMGHPSEALASIPAGAFVGTGFGNDAALPGALAAAARSLQGAPVAVALRAIASEYLTNNEYSPQARAAISAALRAAGHKTPATDQERDAVAAAAGGPRNIHVVDTGAVRLRTANPNTGNVTLTPVTDFTPAGIAAALAAHKKETKQRDAASNALKRAQQQVDSE
jgi:hypothetical protein